MYHYWLSATLLPGLLFSLSAAFEPGSDRQHTLWCTAMGTAIGIAVLVAIQLELPYRITNPHVEYQEFVAAFWMFSGGLLGVALILVRAFQDLPFLALPVWMLGGIALEMMIVGHGVGGPQDLQKRLATATAA